MTSHLEESLERDIERIRGEIRDMSAIVERSLQDCARAFVENDRQLAYAVILRDQYIDEKEKAIDQLCLRFLDAGITGVVRNVGFSDAVYFEFWPVHVFVGQDHDGHNMAALDIRQGLAFFIQQEITHGDRRLYDDLAGKFLHAFFFQQADDGKREGFNASNGTVAIASGAGFLAGFAQ